MENKKCENCVKEIISSEFLSFYSDFGYDLYDDPDFKSKDDDFYEKYYPPFCPECGNKNEEEKSHEVIDEEKYYPPSWV